MDRDRAGSEHQGGMRMMLSRRSRLAVWLAILMTLVGSAAAAADTYPTRPIRLIVPFAAGGPHNDGARLGGPELERPPGQPVISGKRPAAGGIVCTEATG